MHERSLLFFITLFFLGCGKNKPAPVIPPTEFKKLSIPKDGNIYLGAFANYGKTEDLISRKKIEDFENLADKRVAWAYISNNWTHGIHYPKKNIHTIADNAQTPFIRFLPRSDYGENDHSPDPLYSLQNIIDGKFDKALKIWAREAKIDNIPLLIDFGVEMTGNWMSWSGVYNGAGTLDAYGDPAYPDGPERFRDAYRHIIDLFKAEGANHITWFFHPDIQRIPNQEWNSAKYYYPGDDYIDWIGLSVYGAQHDSDKWNLFSQLLEMWHAHIEDISDSKPIALLEFGVTERRIDGKSEKEEWLDDAFDSILANPYFDFKALSYWHETWTNDDNSISELSIDSSSASIKKFQERLRDPRFISKTAFQLTQ